MFNMIRCHTASR